MTIRRLWPVVVLFGFLAFLFWFFVVLIPILAVETKYQAKQFFSTLGFDSIQSLFRPDFEGMTIVGNTSENKAYGILVPRLGIDEPVIFNVDPNDEVQYQAALKQGIAHASSTGYPEENKLGYYFAHSSSVGFQNQFNAVFYLLHKLEKDDEIYIWHEHKRYRYLVIEKQIKQPGDVAFLYDNYQDGTIVLQTCWPPGTTKERLLVFAKRVNK